jgi:uncharacterized membrane protein
MPRRAAPAAEFFPLFKLLVWVDVGLFAVTFGAFLYAGLADAVSSPARERVLNTCDHLATAAAGAFFGLLGGRVARAERRVPR